MKLLDSDLIAITRLKSLNELAIYSSPPLSPSSLSILENSKNPKKASIELGPSTGRGSRCGTRRCHRAASLRVDDRAASIARSARGSAFKNREESLPHRDVPNAPDRFLRFMEWRIRKRRQLVGKEQLSEPRTDPAAYLSEYILITTLSRNPLSPWPLRRMVIWLMARQLCLCRSRPSVTHSSRIPSKRYVRELYRSARQFTGAPGRRTKRVRGHDLESQELRPAEGSVTTIIGRWNLIAPHFGLMVVRRREHVQ